MNREQILLAVVAIILVVTVVQAFQLSGIVREYSANAVPAQLPDLEPVQASAPPSSAGSAMVGGC